MKKILLALSAMLLIGAAQSLKAQSYRTAGGLFIDFGNGATLVGPHVKHFINQNGAIQGMVLFGNGLTALGVEYSYNEPIRNAAGLMWNVGVGPQAAFGDGSTDFLVRPALGLEYKVPNAPINFGFDWRPAWQLTHGSDFEAGRFGIAFRYVFH
ncbi:hypothetical protein SAMN05192529_11031 [Arachidicoccus rhizosphaerae]|jgi:hypothetical protein|uniref:Outer membrane protein beta-barrel domain-containing protein n=1 Tax=Arachidicoccus rhizosphaerae TaxID=551991 RepID=A0A1H3Z5W4_9BACT|nr:hypothetical protein [Arachidicoccus rhizosphaerae]SEA18898.1 hypothetical protein SAMN05192529_11031 [Arachidicoccus rhizosphaerae]